MEKRDRCEVCNAWMMYRDVLLIYLSGRRESGLLVTVLFEAEDGIRDLVRSRGLGDVYKRQGRSLGVVDQDREKPTQGEEEGDGDPGPVLSLIHI